MITRLKDKMFKVKKWGIVPSLKWYYYVHYKISGFQESQKMAKFPLNIMVEVTSHCNIQCVMCPREVMTRKEGIMDFGLYTKIIDETTRHGKPYLLTLHFSGEPLINKRLPEMIKYAKNKGVPIVRLNSNGTLLDETKSRELLNSGLDIITIAIEANKEIHKKVRIGSDFDAVKDNVKQLAEMKKELKLKKPNIRVQILTMDDVTDKIVKDGINMWEPIVDYVNVASISTAGGQVDDLGSTREKKKYCKEIWTNMIMLWNGDVTVCCADHDARLKVGNILEESIEDIWNGERYQRIRELHLKGEYDKLPLCKQCMNAKKS